MHDGRAIANYILDFSESQGREVTQLSLQKLVFFCHAWSLVGLGSPLVKHLFEAWQYGPVLQYLYRDFKGNEKSPISSRAKKLNPETGGREVVPYHFDEQTRLFLNRVISFYGRLKPGTLVELSHVEGGPWHKVWYHEGHVNPGMTISNEAILSYYSQKVVPF